MNKLLTGLLCSGILLGCSTQQPQQKQQSQMTVKKMDASVINISLKSKYDGIYESKFNNESNLYLTAQFPVFESFDVEYSSKFAFEYTDQTNKKQKQDIGLDFKLKVLSYDVINNIYTIGMTTNLNYIDKYKSSQGKINTLDIKKIHLSQSFACKAESDCFIPLTQINPNYFIINNESLKTLSGSKKDDHVLFYDVKLTNKEFSILKFKKES